MFSLQRVFIILLCCQSAHLSKTGSGNFFLGLLSWHLATATCTCIHNYMYTHVHVHVYTCTCRLVSRSQTLPLTEEGSGESLYNEPSSRITGNPGYMYYENQPFSPSHDL